MRLPRTASVLLVKRELSRRFSKGQVWPSFIRLRKVVHKKVPGPAGPAGAAAAAAVQWLVELPDFAPVPEAGEGAGAVPPAPEASLNECGVGPGSELVMDVQVRRAGGRVGWGGGDIYLGPMKTSWGRGRQGASGRTGRTRVQETMQGQGPQALLRTRWLGPRTLATSNEGWWAYGFCEACEE